MRRTPRPHFEELDWLDYAQGLLDPEEKAAIEEHLSACAACAGRLRSLRRMARALPAARELLDARAQGPKIEDQAFAAGAAAHAAEVMAGTDHAGAELEAWGFDPPRPESLPDLSQHHVLSAIRVARELFGTDLERSRALVGWSEAALEVLSARAGGELAWEGLRGAVRSCAAYLLLRQGKAPEALEELERARQLLKKPVPLRDLEIAFCSYVRASCLHDLTRFDEALEEIAVAEEIYGAFGDGRRHARSRFLRAILLSDGGSPEEALPIYEELLRSPDMVADPRIYALLHLSLANDLVFTGDTGRARIVYARAAGLLKKTGQEDRLFRIRVGLADIAYREGRTKDALAINLRLRPVFRERRLPWGEVRRELWIVRQLLELGRFEEARGLCATLAGRAEELCLREEARRALSYLARADRELSVESIARVQGDLERISRGGASGWSIA